MPFQIESPQQNTIVAYLHGDLSIEQIQKLNNLIVTSYLIKEKAAYIIYEVSNLEKFPTNLSQLRIASEPIATNKAVKMQIVTGVRSPIFNFLFEIVGQLFKQSLKKANTLEEALIIVSELKAKASFS